MEKIKNDLKYPVLRVTQLDTNELDEALLLNLQQSINQDFFKYTQYTFFQKYHIEIFTAVKFLLWYHTYNKNTQTIGQSILYWSYRTKNNYLLIKKITHCLFYCFDEWFCEKFPNLIKQISALILKKRYMNLETGDQDIIDSREINKKIDKIINFIKISLKFGSFINYLIFLFNGKYLNLWERLLDLRPVYLKEQLMRNYNHEVSEREQLWQTYFSLLKLIDNIFNIKIFFSKMRKNYRTKSQNNNANLTIDINLCALCENEPTLVHVTINYDKPDSCKHFFCYYCIKKALLENENKFNCSLCNKTIYNVEFYSNNENL